MQQRWLYSYSNRTVAVVLTGHHSHRVNEQQQPFNSENERMEAATEDPVGGSTKGDRKGKDRFTIRDLFADERCTSAILDFLRTTKVGSRVGPRAVPPKPGEDGEAAERGAGEAE